MMFSRPTIVMKDRDILNRPINMYTSAPLSLFSSRKDIFKSPTPATHSDLLIERLSNLQDSIAEVNSLASSTGSMEIISNVEIATSLAKDTAADALQLLMNFTEFNSASNEERINSYIRKIEQKTLEIIDKISAWKKYGTFLCEVYESSCV